MSQTTSQKSHPPPDDSNTATLRSRLLVAGLGLLAISAIGTIGYYLLGHGVWSLGDCAYMTVISLTTVGYGEVLRDLNHVPYARLFTAFLLVGGAGLAVYFVSVLTTFLVEGEFVQSRRRKKMYKQIQNMTNHIIVCGAGGTAKHVVNELVAAHWDFVVIDNAPERLERLQEAHQHKLATIFGDATDDKVLLEAGIKKAYGIVTTLPDDKGNLYVVVTARGLNPKLRVVAKAVDQLAEHKLKMAGANSVVSVNTIGGLRMVSEMIRPNVVTFLDKMMRDQEKRLRFEEVTIPPGSSLVRTRLAHSDIRKERNLLIVAAMSAETGEYTYSPGPDFTLEANMTLILLGETESVMRLRTSSLFVREEQQEG